MTTTQCVSLWSAESSGSTSLCLRRWRSSAQSIKVSLHSVDSVMFSNMYLFKKIYFTRFIDATMTTTIVNSWKTILRWELFGLFSPTTVVELDLLTLSCVASIKACLCRLVFRSFCLWLTFSTRERAGMSIHWQETITVYQMTTWKWLAQGTYTTESADSLGLYRIFIVSYRWFFVNL